MRHPFPPLSYAFHSYLCFVVLSGPSNHNSSGAHGREDGHGPHREGETKDVFITLTAHANAGWHCAGINQRTSVMQGGISMELKTGKC